MSLQAIKTIREVEETAAKAKADAAAISKKLIAEAEEKGKQSVLTAKKMAEEEVADMRRKAAEKARESALELVRNTENRKATMLVRANSKADLALGFVIERIVKS